MFSSKYFTSFLKDNLAHLSKYELKRHEERLKIETKMIKKAALTRLVMNIGE